MNFKSIFKQFWFHLDAWHKILIVMLIIFMIIVSFIEVLSIGAVVPFLTSIVNPDLLYNNEKLKPFIVYFEIKNSNQIVMPSIIIFIVFSVLSLISRIFLVFSQNNINKIILNHFAAKAFYNSLSKPFSFYIKTNSSEILAGILSKVSGGIGNYLSSILIIISSTFLLVTILITVLMINLQISLISLFIICTLLSIGYYGTKKYLIFLSEKINISSNEVVKIIQEGLGSIREIILNQQQKLFFNNFRIKDNVLRAAQLKVNVIASLPRFLLEGVLMLSVGFFALFLIGKDKQELIDFIPLIGALALTVQKVLPVFNSLFSSFVQIAGSKKLLDDAFSLLNSQSNSIIKYHKKIQFKKHLKFQNLYFSYDGKNYIFKNFNLIINKGDKVGIIGESGTGKTTFIDILSGFYNVNKGKILVDNINLNEKNISNWQNKISYIPQSIFYLDDTIIANIAFGKSKSKVDLNYIKKIYFEANLDKILDFSDLERFENIGERGLKLSGGQRQRIGIARGLYKDSEILIFDESTNELDSKNSSEIVKNILTFCKDKTIFFVSHKKSLLKDFDYILEFKNGNYKKI